MDSVESSVVRAGHRRSKRSLSWLNVKKDGVEFEESGGVNALQAVYYLKDESIFFLVFNSNG